MPDSEPAEFEDFDDAKQHIIEILERFADEEGETGNEALAEDYTYGAEDVNLESSDFSGQVGAYVFWVVQDGTMGLDEDEEQELAALEDLAAQCEGYGDWEHGEGLIRESYFTEYAQELAEDIGAIDRNATWPLYCIDWDQAARDLKQDYMEVDFDGVSYFMRSA